MSKSKVPPSLPLSSRARFPIRIPPAPILRLADGCRCIERVDRILSFSRGLSRPPFEPPLPLLRLPPRSAGTYIRLYLVERGGTAKGGTVGRDYGKAMCPERDNERATASLETNGEIGPRTDEREGTARGEEGPSPSGRVGPIRLYRLIMQIVRPPDKWRSRYRSPRTLLLGNAAANAAIGVDACNGHHRFREEQ